MASCSPAETWLNLPLSVRFFRLPRRPLPRDIGRPTRWLHQLAHRAEMHDRSCSAVDSQCMYAPEWVELGSVLGNHPPRGLVLDELRQRKPPRSLPISGPAVACDAQRHPVEFDGVDDCMRVVAGQTRRAGMLARSLFLFYLRRGGLPASKASRCRYARLSREFPPAPASEKGTKLANLS